MVISEYKIALKSIGKYDPNQIEDYITIGGYKSVRKALSIQPEKIIDSVINSGLRGRGGAGFSTGLKEKFTNQSKGIQKFVICNADEGEPGTFKDRVIMEQDPHVLLEGMLISAYAIQATKAYIYIRGEYTESIKKLQTALKQANEKGFIGKNIFNSGFDLDFEIKLGAGSYLCGEELTLLESLEGKRGYPRIKPPFPAEKGLFGKPTLVNNVETFAHIPYIIEKGAEHYKSMGTDDSPGTKIFTISGDVKKPGYYETEMGVSLRELIYDFAGGIKDNKDFYAAILGGAAGTFVNETVLDTPMAYDTLKEKGAVLGSGAIMIMSEGRSLFDMTNSILEFFKHESCGKCVPCRIGMPQLLLIMENVKNNKLERLEALNLLLNESEYMAKSSLCPLGQSPILPIKSLKQYFENQF
ncbi:MAG: NADH-quinone oxidoreductase subunit NuoF [Marinilabiliales bacterium]|nr:MAG: NADH-quinone oxidoreductase subunit NuoF [Marinilabiliales bacterium]